MGEGEGETSLTEKGAMLRCSVGEDESTNYHKLSQISSKL